MRKYVFKLSLIFIVIVLAVSSVALLYSAYSNFNIKEQYRALHGFSMQNAANEFDGEIAAAFDTLAAAQNTVPEGYYAQGFLSADNRLILVTSAATSSIELTQLSASRIRNGEKSISKQTIDGEHLLFFAEQKAEGYGLLISRYDSFTARVGVYELENVMLCNASGLIIASTAAAEQDTLYHLVSYDSFGEMEDGKGIFAEIDGKTKYITTKKSALADYYIIGYTDSQKMADTIRKENIGSIFYVVAVAAVSFLGAFFIILFFSIQNNKNLVGAFTRGKYSIFIDKYGRILYKNAKFKEEFSHTEIISYTIDNNEKLQKALSGGGDVTLKLKNRQGEFRFIRLMTAKAFSGFRMIGADVTEIMCDYIKAKRDVECDRLTGLPSMRLLEKEYEDIQRNDFDEKCCVAVLEITNSNSYRSMFGAKFYSRALKLFAERLNERFTHRVYQEDESFIIFAPKTVESDFLMLESDRYIAQLSLPIAVDNSSVRLSIKMGLSKVFSPRDRRSLDEPLLQAKQSLHIIKRTENKKWGVYYDALQKNDLAVYESKQAVLDLIDKDELTLHFQPQFSVSKNRIVGFEGLARVTKKLSISVKELIELAEKNGSIIEIGEQVYRKAMEFAAALGEEDVTVSLNVSPVQLMQEGFVEKFLARYRKYNLRKGSIAIEITESFLMSSFDNTIVKLEILDKEGIAIHLDDFGVEYSSMLYLKKLPIKVIKIDREFIKDIDTNSYSSLIAGTFIKLADSLDLCCVAEGAETKEQVDTLIALGCDIIQGYYFGKAMPKEEAVRLLNDYKNRGRK